VAWSRSFCIPSVWCAANWRVDRRFVKSGREMPACACKIRDADWRLCGRRRYARRHSRGGGGFQSGLAGLLCFGQSRGVCSSNPASEIRSREYFAARAFGLAALPGSLLARPFCKRRSAGNMVPSSSETASPPGQAWTSPYEIAAAQHGLEEKLKTAPEYAAFFERLKTTFPWNMSLFGGFFESARAGRGIGSTDSLWRKPFIPCASHADSGGQSRQPGLGAYFRIQSSMLRALAAKDPHLCVDFLNGAESSGFFEFRSKPRPCGGHGDRWHRRHS